MEPCGTPPESNGVWMKVKQRFFCVQPRLVAFVTAVLSLVDRFEDKKFVGIVLLVTRPEVTTDEKINDLRVLVALIIIIPLMYAAYFVGAIIALVLSTINLICSSLMIYGCVERSKYFLLPWFVLNFLQIVFCFVKLFEDKDVFKENPRWWISVPTLVGYLYLWLYVLVCYKEFLDTSKQYRPVSV